MIKYIYKNRKENPFMELTNKEIDFLIDLIADEEYNYGDKYAKRADTTCATVKNKLENMKNDSPKTM